MYFEDKSLENAGKTTLPTQPKVRLVVFDVEGVLLPKRRYLLFEASRRIGFWKFLRFLWVGFLYETGMMSLQSGLKTIFRQLRGLAIDDLFRLYQRIPWVSGVKEVFSTLNEEGIKTALISSGLPQPFVEDLAAQVDAKHAFGLELEVTNGHLTGEIGGDVLKPEGKAMVLKGILEEEGLRPQDCALVADDRNNLPMFNLCRLKIGYNSDFLLSAKSDVVVRGDLSEVLPHLIETQQFSSNLHSLSKSDLIREAIHLGGLFVPFVCLYFVDRRLAAFLIFLATMLYIVSELARMQGFNLPVTSTITWKAATKPELHEFVTAPMYFAAGIMLSLIVFPELIGYASIAILTLGDGFATLLGKRFGRTVFPYNKGKRVEGSILGLVFAFAGAMLFVDPYKALVGAAAGMLMETLPLPVSDNLTVPLVAGLAMLPIP